MDKVTVILKSLEKADYTKIGFMGRSLWELHELMKIGWEFLFRVEDGKLKLQVTSSKDNLYNEIAEWSIRDIIFDPDFAKGLWGEQLMDWTFDRETVKNTLGITCKIPKWKGHLQQLVISDSYYEYLKKFVK